MKPEYGFSVGGLRIAVRARAYPSADDFWDGNWLVTPISARFGGFRADVPDALLRATEIAGFRDELRLVASRPLGSARLSSLEEWLDLTVTATGPERLEVTGELRDHPGSGCRLAFTVQDVDRSGLAVLLGELDDVVATFPVLGSP